MKWGLLGPEMLGSQRRVRTLGLATVVRHFNDLAAPGMGGVWFGKQLLIAVLGVALAQQIRMKGRQASNIDVANAVEAIACWLSLNHGGWAADPRVLGRLKMRSRTDDLSFRRVRRQGFYVTQPMRMRTVQPLLALGFVESASERFNSFACTEMGGNFIEIACHDYRPNRTTVLKSLLAWTDALDADAVKTGAMRQALSPTEQLSVEARELVREALVARSSDRDGRRSKLLEWMDNLDDGPKRAITWEQKPAQLDDAHWQDIRSGGHFFSARNAALQVLDEVETHLGGRADQRLGLSDSVPDNVRRGIFALRVAARRFLAEGYDPSLRRLATTFCIECSDADESKILRRIVERDNRVLQLVGEAIVPAAAFRGWSTQVDEEELDGGNEGGAKTDHDWPEGISVRIQNMLLLNADLRGRLGDKLEATSEREAVDNG